mmetsp:Transcript_101713/g.255018  ORF Transcript_101713/g.255018 Transcript_101713/m.255018 type:complete len:224 (+) Transcript_101713:275-946(+)
MSVLTCDTSKSTVGPPPSGSKMTKPEPAWMSSLKLSVKTGLRSTLVSPRTGMRESTIGAVESPMVWMSRFVVSTWSWVTSLPGFPAKGVPASTSVPRSRAWQYTSYSVSRSKFSTNTSKSVPALVVTDKKFAAMIWLIVGGSNRSRTALHQTVPGSSSCTVTVEVVSLFDRIPMTLMMGGVRSNVNRPEPSVNIGVASLLDAGCGVIVYMPSISSSSSATQYT